MKKVFDQTVRDLKREVNKKVLKVPGIEQKVLDSTSNEPWGPHGSLLADIAAATRNHHEYQIIMTVIWKRISDTGKNWRHVYKGLVVLEYLVANGSERAIDEIREHAYQISTLSEFQYIDSSGRDQGINVRRKSQSLVALVNDKERISEVRQKAAANREKFHNIPAGGMYRSGSYSGAGGYDDDRYEGRNGSRDEDRNGYGYGREKEWGYKDDDRNGRYIDPYSRDGDRYGRDHEERYGRDGYREDEFRGRSQSVDNYRHGSRSISSDRDRDRSFDDDGQYSYRRGSGARADEHSQDGRRIERKFSEQNIGAPPNYEEAVSEIRSPVYSERDAEASATSAPTSSPPINNQPASSPSESNNPSASPHARNHPASSPTSYHPSQENSAHGFTVSPVKHEVEAANEFDPRVPNSAIPVTNNAEMDLLGSLSDSFASNSLAVVPSTSPYATSEVETYVNSGSTPTGAAAAAPSNFSQPFEDPFGDGPFKAIPSTDATHAQPQTSASADSLQLGMNQIVEPTHDVQKIDMGSNFEFPDALSGLTFSASDMYSVQAPTSLQALPQESASQQNIDVLADILPPSGPMLDITSQPTLSGPGAQLVQPGGSDFGIYEVNPGAIVPANTIPQTQSGPASEQNGGNYLPYGQSIVPGTSYMAPQTSSGPNAYFTNGNFVSQGEFTAPNGGNFYSQQGGFTAPIHGNYYSQGGSQMGNQSQFSGGNFLPQPGFAVGVSPQVQTPTGLPSHNSNKILGNIASQTAQQQALPSSSGSLAAVGQSAKDKFEPKSAVWADTLSRGLVNLNISGSKTNPMVDIGIDFDAINRKEKRMEKQPAQAPLTSTVNMGKAMGSGSGLGRAGAGVLRPQANTMMGSGMGMSGVPGGGMSMGGYGGMNHPMGGIGMGMGVNPSMGMGTNPGMGMNMGMGQGVPMQMPSGLPPSSNMSGYNPMMGPGGYGQHPYGGHQ